MNTVSVCADSTGRDSSVDIKGILATLQGRIGPQKFDAWFRHGTAFEVQNGAVQVGVPNYFVASWIDSHYRNEIMDAVALQLGKALPVSICVDPTLSKEVRQRQFDRQAEIVTRTHEGRTRPRQPVAPLRLRHTLDTFIVGASNRLAYSSAVALASGSSVPFSSLFIHGPCGVGKTHLLQGVCNAAGRNDGGKANCRYVTGEQFTNDYITSLRHKKLNEFRGRYRKLDLLAIDDVHFLSAKRATQEEFLHTFNAIDAAGKRVVMASDAHPHLVGELNEQLVSRFVAGMVVKVETPDQATRYEILRRKAETMGLKVPPDVLEYVAMHIRGSVRELEGTLVKLSAVASLERGPVTLTMASGALSDHLARTDSAITLSDIEATVAAYFGVTPADLHSSRRTRTVSVARMVTMYLARHHTQMSFPEIGKFMGKNHSSVVLACQRMESLLADQGQIKWTTPMGPKVMPANELLEILQQQFS